MVDYDNLIYFVIFNDKTFLKEITEKFLFII